LIPSKYLALFLQLDVLIIKHKRMKRICFSLIVTGLLFISTAAFSQVTKVPQIAKDNFAKQYPKAENVDWDNDVVDVTVQFDQAGERLTAEYSNKGIWKSTQKDIAYEKLPTAVVDGFKKSKYADREVTDTKMIYYPADVIQYRVKVEKNDIEKKYVWFDENGRLIRESITL